MAFVSEMFDQLRDLLSDPGDNQVSFAMKKMYLNLGVTHLWPQIPRMISATAIPIVALTYEYNLSSIVSEHDIISIDIESDNASGSFRRLSYYDLLPGDEDNVSVLRLYSLPTAGATIRIRHTQPIATIVASTYAAAQSEVFLGPDKAIGLPVLYAMGLMAVRRMEDYLDASRQRPANESERVDVSGLLGSSRFWMDEYNSQVLNLARPLPIVED